MASKNLLMFIVSVLTAGTAFLAFVLTQILPPIWAAPSVTFAGGVMGAAVIYFVAEETSSAPAPAALKTS